ncbi:hypothetical protein HMN09_00197300 [Mycena chlorophos]|uniref:Protein kinase domain-containing protein n=1 Tax=Mycena chlorophos TaxID=658473 RepID=A0A8H6TQP8_MYCCL|nr:hypothetical protein HMN09_00197300 [Mycena chlorophos]
MTLQSFRRGKKRRVGMERKGAVNFINGENYAEGRDDPEELFVAQLCTGRFYLLVQDRLEGGMAKYLVVQAPSIVPSGSARMRSERMQGCQPGWDSKFLHGLQIIHSLLSSVNFGRANWAYLQGSNNNYRLVPKFVSLSKITARPWTTLIPESELEITGYTRLSAEDRLGRWRERDVDVFRAWNDRTVKELQQMMVAFQRLAHAGLTDIVFNVLGHVHDACHDIVGVVQEPACGRTVRVGDRSKVYSALAKVERAGLVYMSIHPSNILIDPWGSVRLRLSNFKQASHLDAKDEILRWTHLRDMFDELENAPEGMHMRTTREMGPCELAELAPLPNLNGRMGRELGMAFGLASGGFVLIGNEPKPSKEALAEAESRISSRVARITKVRARRLHARTGGGLLALRLSN